MKKIDSLNNPLIKEIASLQHAKYRYQHGRYTAEGKRVIETLLAAGQQYVHLLGTQEHYQTAQAIGDDKNEPFVVSQSIMAKISSSKTPSGLLGVFNLPAAKKFTATPARPILVLAQIQDPGNMGTLIRSSVAFGIREIIIVEGTDPWSPKVVQATAGTIGYATIYDLSWDELQTLKGNMPLYALVAHAGENPRLLQEQPGLIVVGNEAHGIPEDWLGQCDKQITIPMNAAIESLNAAIAGSIALYLISQKP